MGGGTIIEVAQLIEEHSVPSQAGAWLAEYRIGGE
jgi:hypothetical protein